MRKYKFICLTFCVLFSLILFSCESTEPEVDVEEDPFYKVDDNFHMEIFERSSFDSSSNSYFQHELRLITEHIYGCCNFSIVVNKSSGSKSISLEIDSIYMPQMCLTALGPASFIEEISLEENNSTILTFMNGNVSNKFNVEVSDSLIHIAPIEDSYIKVSENFIWRFKENSFVYSCGTTEETSWMYDDLKDSILAIQGIEQFNYPEYGRIPYPRDPGGYWVNHPCLFFTYNDEADWEILKNILIDYSKNTISQYMGVGIYIQNFLGEKEWSWKYD